MKKEAFLRALEGHLEGMTAEERARALEFCAESIDDRISCECLSCFPDMTDDSCNCAWKFTLKA